MLNVFCYIFDKIYYIVLRLYIFINLFLTAMKKFIFSFLFLIIGNICFAQLWGSWIFGGRVVTQVYGKWCMFACVEMKTQHMNDKCISATAYVRMFNNTTANCCDPFQEDDFEKYCLNGVHLLKAPLFLGRFHHATAWCVPDVTDVFVRQAGVSYKFPCYGFINNLTHCVLVTGVELTGDSDGNQIWRVFFVDPDNGQRDSRTLYKGERDIELLFIE